MLQLLAHLAYIPILTSLLVVQAEKVHFYTSLPSYEVFMIVFEHVAPHLSRRPGSTILNRFQ